MTAGQKVGGTVYQQEQLSRGKWGREYRALVRVLGLCLSEGQLAGRPSGVMIDVAYDQRPDHRATEIFRGLRGRQDISLVVCKALAC